MDLCLPPRGLCTLRGEGEGGEGDDRQTVISTLKFKTDSEGSSRRHALSTTSITRLWLAGLRSYQLTPFEYLNTPTIIAALLGRPPLTLYRHRIDVAANCNGRWTSRPVMVEDYTRCCLGSGQTQQATSSGLPLALVKSHDWHVPSSFVVQHPARQTVSSLHSFPRQR